MKNNAKVSLIVAVYKSAPFLDKLITSIIKQTYQNIEVILVDDGSPDNSGEICDAYAAKDERIKVIHKVNGGTCEARNYGLNAATGDYVMIIDGDDWLSLDCVEYMMKLINETGSTMAFSDKVFTSRDQVQIEHDHIETWTAEDATAAIIYPHMAIGPWNKIYSLKLLRDNNISFSVPWFGEGLYFAATAAQHANHVGVGHRKVYNYRLNNVNSGVTNYNVQHGLNALRNIQTIKDNLYINTPKLRNAADWHIWNNYFFLLKQIIGSDTTEKYAAEYKKCRQELRGRMLSVLLKSEVNMKQKMKILGVGICPVYCAKKSINKAKIGLANDKMD